MINFIIFIIILFISVIIIYKLFKTILKTMIFLFILSSIIGVLLGYFVILDIKDLQNNLLNSTNIIILANSNIKTGLIIAIGGENTTILTDDELMNYQQSYINKDYKSILSNRFKLIIIKTRILNNLLPEKEIINGKKN